MKKVIAIFCSFIFLGNQFLFAMDQEILVALQDLYDQGISTVSMQNTSPDEPMSRREAALLMDKYTDKLLGTPKTTDTCQFYDLTISEGIKQAIIASCQKGIFKGKNGFFRPYDMMTRGQLIIVVARLLSGNPALELDEAYTYLLREKIIKIDDRNNASRLINKSELYIVLSRNIYGAANQNMGDPLNQIFKIKSYQKNYLFGTIENIAHGSAVLIDDNTLLTNAHVVVDEYQNPTGMYEICRSLTMNTDPICFTYADLIYYDLENDLALLSLPDDVDLSNPITLATSTARENDQVTTYGYPRDGGDTITSAKGVVSGYEKGMIKTDAAINFGNSGGGAYDKYGRLMGIPTQVAENIGYLIPVDKIQTFLDKEGTITEDEENVDQIFMAHLQTLQKKIYASTIQENLFSTDALGNYAISDLVIDADPDLVSYSLTSPDKETQLYLQTTRVFGQVDTAAINEQAKQLFEESFLDRSQTTLDVGDATWSVYSGQGVEGSEDLLFVTYSLNKSGSIGVDATLNTSTNKKESIKDAVQLIKNIEVDDIATPIIKGNIQLGPLKFEANDFVQIYQGAGKDISFTITSPDAKCEVYFDSNTKTYNDGTFETLAEAGEDEFSRYEEEDIIDQGVVKGEVNRYRGYLKDYQEDSHTADYYTYVISPYDSSKVTTINIRFTCTDRGQATFDKIQDWVKTIDIDATEIFD